MTFADVQAAFCSVLVDEWARAGVTEAVVAPGSRSTPLVLALDSDDRIRVHVVLDERSAGFVALGLGMRRARPALVVTTSGTAAVELHPAVVEASQAGVALIAVTTDRPPELHHVGAPQTVEQEGLFASAVRWAFSPGVADLQSAASWRSLASRCVAEAVGSPLPGPVHINLAFREPLLGDASRVDVPPGRDGGDPWHSPTPAGAEVPAEVVELLASFAGGRGLIVAGGGTLPADGSADALLDAARRLGWPVFADARSGCRAPSALVVASADALLRINEVARWEPEVVVRAGAPWSSKVLSQWLGALPSAVPQVVVDRFGRWSDPERSATRVLQGDPASLLRAASPAGEAGGEWASKWHAVESAAQAALDAALGPGSPLDLSEPAVARAVVGGVAPGGQVVVSSSMPVRDVEWYGAPRHGLRVLSNRGANGIDGVLSTALGAALVDGGPTVALVGDLAFVYDAGALLWASARDVSLTIVAIDNDGGGIFSFLPQASSLDPATFERYWGTPHGIDLVALASAYGVEADRIASRAGLDAVVRDAGKPGVRVAVVQSSRVANVEAHDRVNAAIAASVRSVL